MLNVKLPVSVLTLLLQALFCGLCYADPSTAEQALEDARVARVKAQQEFYQELRKSTAQDPQSREARRKKIFAPADAADAKAYRLMEKEAQNADLKDKKKSEKEAQELLGKIQKEAKGQGMKVESVELSPVKKPPEPAGRSESVSVPAPASAPIMDLKEIPAELEFPGHGPSPQPSVAKGLKSR